MHVLAFKRYKRRFSDLNDDLEGWRKEHEVHVALGGSKEDKMWSSRKWIDF